MVEAFDEKLKADLEKYCDEVKSTGLVDCFIIGHWEEMNQKCIWTILAKDFDPAKFKKSDAGRQLVLSKAGYTFQKSFENSTNLKLRMAYVNPSQLDRLMKSIEEKSIQTETFYFKDLVAESEKTV